MNQDCKSVTHSVVDIILRQSNLNRKEKKGDRVGKTQKSVNLLAKAKLTFQSMERVDPLFMPTSGLCVSKKQNTNLWAAKLENEL